MLITKDVRLPDFPVVDMHVHLPIQADDWLAPWRTAYIRDNGQERWEQLQALQQSVPSWLPEYGFPEPDEPFAHWQDAAPRWAQECRDHQLGRVVFVTGGSNEILSEVVKSEPDLFSGFAHHPPETTGAAEMLEQAVRQGGLCGYKILAPLVQTPLDSPRFDALFEVCHGYKLPVLVHFGILGGAGGVVSGPNMNPLILARAAQRFPHAHFIVPHFGCGYTEDLLRLCWACPNVYVDSSGNNLWTKWTMANYTLEQLFARFYATIGPRRMIFGSDSEWFPRGFALRYLLDQLRAVYALNMPEEHIRLIFRENALRLLHRDG
jgi:predicted TIM-barrel fold metal-dependent hydrolase